MIDVTIYILYVVSFMVYIIFIQFFFDSTSELNLILFLVLIYWRLNLSPISHHLIKQIYFIYKN
jgi:hypothetical protein